jgi:uncharacterized membrane protein YgcG
LRQIVLTLLISLLALNTQAWEWPSLWEGSLLTKIGLTKSRIQDKPSLLPWGHRLKVNQYLDKVATDLDIDWRIIILTSLQGGDIEKKADESLSDRQDNAAVFILSQSDRTFKLAFSSRLKSRLGEDRIQEMVSLIIPSLSKSDIQNALFLLLEASAYQLKPDYHVSPPRPSIRKHQSLKGLTYFLAAFLFIFLLGHKIFRSPAMKAQYETKPSLQKEQAPLFHHAFFLKSGASLSKAIFEPYTQRLEILASQSSMNFAFYETRVSDLYPAAHFRSSLALSILALTGLYFFPLEWQDPIYILAVLAQALILGYLLAFLPRVKKFFTSKREMKEETFQLLIETLSKTSNILNQKSLIIGYSKLENKIDFIYSSQLLEGLQTSEGNDVNKKVIAQFFKDQTQLLRAGDLSSFIDSLIAFVELALQKQSSYQVTTTETHNEIKQSSTISEERQILTDSSLPTEERNQDQLKDKGEEEQ